MSADAVWEVFAVRYATAHRTRAETFLGGDPHDAAMPIDYFVWVIRNGARTFVVDTGFDAAGAAKRGRTITTPVADALAAVGVDHARVEDVILTHLHYDHAGNGALFPAARFHVQDREMAYATGRCMTHGLLRAPFEGEDVVTMVRRLFDGRLAFHDGTDEIAPGITVHLVGGHSKGLQIVRVETARGPLVLASDATHYYEHFETGRAFPIVHDVEALLEGYRTLRRLAPDDSHVVPGHDPLVMARYPAPEPRLEGLAVRLDVPPAA